MTEKEPMRCDAAVPPGWPHVPCVRPFKHDGQHSATPLWVDLFGADPDFDSPSWAGAGLHEGHVVSLADQWPTRIENATVEVSGPAPVVRDGILTCGRVTCSCGEGWTVGGWPAEVHDRIAGRITEGAP